MIYDVAIVGAGLAGSLAARILGDAGYSVTLIDARDRYPDDFRCEKMEADHVNLLRDIGMFEVLRRVSTRTDELWIARYGRLLDVVPFVQYGFRYGDLLNAFRDSIGPPVVRMHATVQRIVTNQSSNRIFCADGVEVDSRLVVMATGLNRRLRASLGFQWRPIGAKHSLCVGFDLAPASGGDFHFPALQYNAERSSTDVGYLSLFRIGSAMRANLFLYHSLDDPIVERLQRRPEDALQALFPNLRTMIGEFAVTKPVRCRSNELAVSSPARVDGVVLVGDAYTTVCPATGLGAFKAMLDVVRLCTDYVPAWLAADDTSAGVIADFYRDRRKAASDRLAMERSQRRKDLATQSGLRPEVTRWLLYRSRFLRGRLRAFKEGTDLGALSPVQQIRTPAAE